MSVAEAAVSLPFSLVGGSHSICIDPATHLDVSKGGLAVITEVQLVCAYNKSPTTMYVGDAQPGDEAPISHGGRKWASYVMLGDSCIKTSDPSATGHAVIYTTPELPDEEAVHYYRGCWKPGDIERMLEPGSITTNTDTDGYGKKVSINHFSFRCNSEDQQRCVSAAFNKHRDRGNEFYWEDGEDHHVRKVDIQPDEAQRILADHIGHFLTPAKVCIPYMCGVDGADVMVKVHYNIYQCEEDPELSAVAAEEAELEAELEQEQDAMFEPDGPDEMLRMDAGGR